MSSNQRIGLIVVAIAVAIAAFVVASPGADDEDGAAQTSPTQTETAPTDGAETTETEPVEEEPAEPPEPEVHRIRIQGGAVADGPQDIDVGSGDTVRIVVTSDAPDEIHLHGYDITRDVGPGSPGRFRFTANLEGSFEMESHVAEDAGRDPLVARLNVEPR